VAGELCIPFLALSGRVQFRQPVYQQLCSNYRLVCLQLIKKARMRGAQLNLPVDILAADESVDDAMRRRCFDKFDKDSRDEGVDYNGDIKSVSVAFPADTHASIEHALLGGPLYEHAQHAYVVPVVVVDGFVYDIGEQTRKQLQEVLSTQCDICVCWGPLGACEISGFQMGTRTLVSSTLLPAWSEGALQAPPDAGNRPLHTWVIGEATSEWFSRYADPDGEQAGDLTESGRLSFVSRSSALVVAILGANKLACLGRLNRVSDSGSRVVACLGSDNEVNNVSSDAASLWKINGKKDVYPEEDDQEEEEEEEEED
jgi:hypothetical protein